MNSLVSTTVTNPNGKLDVCPQMNIDTISSPFIMNNVATVGQKYTLSFWIYADVESTVTVAGSTFNVTTEWTKQSHVFTADSDDLIWIFGSNGTYYLYHAQLEIGNKCTDWRPNPEDVDQSISETASEIHTVIFEQKTSIMSDTEKLVMSAVESKVDMTDYGSFKESTETALDLMAGEISMNFETTKTSIDNLSDSTESKFTKIEKHISFSDNGIAISAGDNSMQLRIDNDIIIFEKNGIPFGQWDGVNFNTGNIRVNVEERAQFGNYAFVPRSDGSLSFLKVADNTGFYATLVGVIMNIYGAHPTLSDNTLIIDVEEIPATLSGTTLILGG